VATFTQLDDADIRAIAALFDLPDVNGWRIIDAGTINSNYAVETAGETVFVRVNEGKDEADVRYEGELVAQLTAKGVPAPSPVQAATGERFGVYRDKYISVFPWVRGGHIDEAGTTDAHTRAVGAALAQLHLAGQGVDVPERLGIYTFDKIVDRFNGFRDNTDAALAPALADIAEEIRWLRAQAEVRSAASRGIIHGDLFRDNVMFDDTELVALIDFEQASTGSFAYDIAVCINAWCYRDNDFDMTLVAGLVAGYAGVRPLSAGDRQAIHVETRLAAMRFTVTRITDVYLADTGATGKDFRDYLRRLQRLRQLDSVLPKSHDDA